MNNDEYLELYHALESICSERVRMALYEKNIKHWIDHPMLLFNDEQFNPEFQKISPFRKIPVIIDHDKNISLFESGAILIYLAEKSGKFYDQNKRTIINQWLIGQMAYIGPMLGQHHQFHHYNPGKSKFGEERYFKICERIYLELDMRLKNSKFLESAPEEVIEREKRICSQSEIAKENIENILNQLN